MLSAGTADLARGRTAFRWFGAAGAGPRSWGSRGLLVGVFLGGMWLALQFAGGLAQAAPEGAGPQRAVPSDSPGGSVGPPSSPVKPAAERDSWADPLPVPPSTSVGQDDAGGESSEPAPVRVVVASLPASGSPSAERVPVQPPPDEQSAPRPSTAGLGRSARDAPVARHSTGNDALAPSDGPPASSPPAPTSDDAPAPSDCGPPTRTCAAGAPIAAATAPDGERVTGEDGHIGIASAGAPAPRIGDVRADATDASVRLPAGDAALGAALPVPPPETIRPPPPRETPLPRGTGTHRLDRPWPARTVASAPDLDVRVIGHGSNGPAAVHHTADIPAPGAPSAPPPTPPAPPRPPPPAPFATSVASQSCSTLSGPGGALLQGSAAVVASTSLLTPFGDLTGRPATGSAAGLRSDAGAPGTRPG